MLARRIIRKKLHKDRKFRRVFMGITAGFLFAILLCFFYAYSFVSQPAFISPVQQGRDLHEGQKGNEVYQKTLLELKKNNILFNSVIPASDSSMVIQLSDGKEVVLSGQKNINEQISSLQLILTRLTMEGREYERLDLRFDKPIISL